MQTIEKEVYLKALTKDGVRYIKDGSFYRFMMNGKIKNCRLYEIEKLYGKYEVSVLKDDVFGKRHEALTYIGF